MKKEDKMSSLHDKLTSRDLNLDNKQLWDELQPRLPEKKSKRRFVFWLSFLFGLLLIVGFYSYYSQSSYDIKSSDTAPVINHEETARPNELITNLEKEIIDEASENPDLGKGSSALKKDNNDILNLQENDKSYIRQDRREVITLSAKNRTVAKQGKDIEFVNSNIKLEGINKIQDVSKMQDKSYSSDVLKNEASRTLAVTEDDVVLEAKDNLTLDGAISNSVSNKFLSILFIPSLDMNIKLERSLEDNVMPSFSLMAEDEIITIRKNNYMFHLSSHFLINSDRHTYKRNKVDFATDLDQFLSIRSGYNMSGGVTYARASGLVFGLELQYNRIYETLLLENRVDQTVILDVDDTFIFEDVQISGNQKLDQVVNQRVRKHNSLTSFEIIPSFGYEYGRVVKVQTTVGPVIALRSRYRGLVITDNYLVTANADSIYPDRGIHLNGLQWSTNVSMKLNTKISVGVSTMYRYQPNVLSQDNAYFSKRIHSLGVGVKVWYSL